MKIAAFYGSGGIHIESHPIPKMTEGKALIKVEASGICGGEYNTYRNRKQLPEAEPGIILGHEVAGRVMVPSGTLQVGDLVAVSPNSGCGVCWYCTHGLAYECRNKPVHTAQTGGGYAEYLVADPAQCYVVPKNISAVRLAMAEPLACCVHSMNRLQVHMGDKVAILGAGGGAQLFIQLANLRGTSTVAVFDNLEERLSLAHDMGADDTYHTQNLDPELIGEQIGGFDVVIVTRSSPGFFEQALRMCAFRGKVLCYGVAAAGAVCSVSPNLMWKKQLSFIGSRSFEGDAFETAVNLLVSNRVKVDRLVNRVISLEQVEWALEHTEGQIKTVIVADSCGEEII